MLSNLQFRILGEARFARKLGSGSDLNGAGKLFLRIEGHPRPFSAACLKQNVFRGLFVAAGTLEKEHVCLKDAAGL